MFVLHASLSANRAEGSDIHLSGQLLSTQLGLSECVGENKLSFSFHWATEVEKLNIVNQIEKCATL